MCYLYLKLYTDDMLDAIWVILSQSHLVTNFHGDQESIFSEYKLQ